MNLGLRVVLFYISDLMEEYNPVVRLNLRDRSDLNRIVGGLTRLSRAVRLSFASHSSARIASRLRARGHLMGRVLRPEEESFLNNFFSPPS